MIKNVLGQRTTTTRTRDDTTTPTGRKEIESFMIKNSLSYKDYVTASAVKAKTNHKVTCSCPGSKPGIINTDIFAHLPNCWVRKRLLSRRSSVNTSAVPRECEDGYVLGVATN